MKQKFLDSQQINKIHTKTAPRKGSKFQYITNKQINVLTDLLHTSKPLGPSKIPAWAIKDPKAALAEPLCYLINQFNTEENFPVDLNEADVTPFQKEIPKTHSIVDLFLSVLLCQKFLKRRSGHKLQVSWKGTHNCLLVNLDIEKKIATFDAILKSTEQIRLELNKKKCYMCVFRSFKGFDSVDHKILLRRLENIGFDEHAINLLENYLSQRMQRVVLNGIESD